MNLLTKPYLAYAGSLDAGSLESFLSISGARDWTTPDPESVTCKMDDPMFEHMNHMTCMLYDIWLHLHCYIASHGQMHMAYCRR